LPRLILAGIAALLAWTILVIAAPAGVVWICGAGGLASSIPQWSGERLLSLTAMWGVMAVAMMVPCIAIRSQARNVLAQPIIVALGGGLTHWALESAAVLGSSSALESNALRVALVLLIVLLELLKWRRASTTASALQMICLPFLGGAMDVGWMVVSTLWMLVDQMLLEQFGVPKGSRVYFGRSMPGANEAQGLEVDNILPHPTFTT